MNDLNGSVRRGGEQPREWTRVACAAVAAGAVGVGLLACASQSSRETSAAPGALTNEAATQETGRRQIARVATMPPVGSAVRVGGDRDAAVTVAPRGGEVEYRVGPCRIDTPLPEGYPPPTPPAAIDLKSYPTVRLAEVAGSGHPDRGMNQAFWPLFNHIKDHGIAMTSPVEMAYTDVEPGDETPSQWTMAFLYRTPDLNGTGTDGAVVVRDAAPLTVVSVGLKGDYSMELVDRGMRAIEDWLVEHPEWEPAGSWRSLYYNGPTLLFWNKWAEVQMPVRPAAARSSVTDGSSQHAAAGE